MDEIERHVRFLDALGVNHVLELGEQCVWRRLGLHQPPVVEVHLRLREGDRELFLSRQAVESGDKVGKVLEHVTKCQIVVVDEIANGISLVLSILLRNPRLERLHLHDIVERRQRQDRNHTLFIDNNLPRLDGENVRVAEQLLHLLPVDLVVESLPLLSVALRVVCPLLRRFEHAAIVLISRLHPWQPILINAITEALRAVDADSSEPIHREEGAYGPPILNGGGHARVNVRHVLVEIGDVRQV
mmetsp:Transcript_18845/g.46908  ORF Transcript_18845/g.46908 Transcript_18845/m.46908 type:complete len:244 (+) Transcript_18845:1298-2029(+)